MTTQKRNLIPQELNGSIPDAYQKYAEKRQALEKSIEIERHKPMSDKEMSILKALSLAMIATLIGAASIVTFTATVPVLYAALAVGFGSLGKAIYHIKIEKSLSEKLNQLIEDYRSGALQLQ